MYYRINWMLGVVAYQVLNAKKERFYGNVRAEVK